MNGLAVFPLLLLLALRVPGEWRLLTPRSAPDDLTLTDLAAVQDQIFAVDSQGGLYRAGEQALERFRDADEVRFTVVWGRQSGEVYAGSAKGEVFVYDGQAVRLLGTPLLTGQRRHHPGVEARRYPVEVTHLWASSPKDVYVAGRMASLFHYDGQEWRDIAFGELEIVGNNATRSGRHIAHASFGPLWGRSDAEVWIARRDPPRYLQGRVLPQNRAAAEQERAAGWPIWRRTGDSWKKTGSLLQREEVANLGRSPSLPEVLHCGSQFLTRLDNGILEWHQESWRRLIELPDLPEGRYWWKNWTAASPDQVLITGHSWQLGSREGWTTFPEEPTPPLGSAIRKLVMTSDGVVGLLTYGSMGTVHVGPFGE